MLRLSFCGVSHSHFPHFGKPTQLFTKLRTSISVHTSYLDWHYLITTFGYTAVPNFFCAAYCCKPLSGKLHTVSRYSNITQQLLHFNYKIDSPICRKVYENASFLLLHIKRLLSNRQGCIRPINLTFDFLQELSGKQDPVQSINFLIAY